MHVDGVLETAIYVDDLPAAEAFYRQVLGLELYSREPGRHVFFRCGAGMLLIFDPRTTASQEVIVGGVTLPRHGASGPGHVAFRVPERDLAAWRERLAAQGIAIEAEVEWPNGGRSIYFRDPAGTSVELATPRLWGLPEVPS